MRFDYSDTNTVSDVKYPDLNIDISEPSKRIWSLVQSENIPNVSTWVRAASESEQIPRAAGLELRAFDSRKQLFGAQAEAGGGGIPLTSHRKFRHYVCVRGLLHYVLYRSLMHPPFHFK
jgi:hypothetical protein